MATGHEPQPVYGHVLIVEDNALVSSAMRILLEATGHTVSEAATVAQAIAMVQAADDPPDVALLDLTLPDGDGLTILTRLRHAGRAPRICVAVTGHDDPQVRERCLAAGCHDVLLKPVAARELARLVTSWMDPGDGSRRSDPIA
ncbi:MAG TPA: response regulator [Gemmatimonadaceae bacterium]|nr:response regulator [Gemmatimonadaceae bacterium]